MTSTFTSRAWARRSALSLAFLVFAAALPSAGCQDPQPPVTSNDGFRPDPQPEKGELVVTVTPAAAKVPLGGDMVLRCKIENKSPVTAHVNVPRLSEDSLSLRVRTTAFDTAWLRRRQVKETATGAMADPAVTKELAPGQSVETEIHVVAVLAGTWNLVPVYSCQAVPQPIAGAPFTVEVTPEPIKDAANPAAQNDRVGVRLETSHGTLSIMLRPELAFNTCEAFAGLARSGFYDGISFHRVIQGFMAQGGAPDGIGWKGPGFQTRRELHGKLPHARGVVAMARTNDPNSAGSQFYICFGPRQQLDELGYTTFGELLDSEEALRRIEKAGADASGANGEAPTEKITITKATLFNTRRP